MKILKYLFLLAVLLLIATSVFVVTEPSEISIAKEKYFKQPINFVVPFFNTTENWTSDNFKIKTEKKASKKNVQFEFGSKIYNAAIDLKDSLKGTKLVLKSTIELTFLEKFNRLFYRENKQQKIAQYLDKQLLGLKDSLNKKTNFYDFEIEGLFQIPEAIVLEKDTLVSQNYLPIAKQKLWNQLELLALKNNLKIEKNPLFYYSKYDQKINIKIQNLVPFDSLWRDSIPSYLTKRPKQLVLQMKVQGPFKGLKHHAKEIQKELDTLRLYSFTNEHYIENEISTYQNSEMPFDWKSVLFLPVLKKQ